MAKHGGALEYDLLTKAGRTLDDLGGALSWRALRHFVQHLDHTSALWRERHKDKAEWFPWLDGTVLPALVADLIDCTNLGRWEYAVSCTTKGHNKPRKPKPVPTPWRKVGKGERRIGKDPIPISQFEDWWESAGRRAKQRNG